MQKKIKDLILYWCVISFTSILIISCGDGNFNAQHSPMVDKLTPMDSNGITGEFIAGISSLSDEEEQRLTSNLPSESIITNNEINLEPEEQNLLTLINTNNIKPIPSNFGPVSIKPELVNSRPVSTKPPILQFPGTIKPIPISQPVLGSKVCLDPDGDGLGTIPGTSTFCQGEKQLDLAVNAWMGQSFNQNTQLTYSIRVGNCTDQLIAYTNGAGCFERYNTNSQVFLQHAQEVGISQTGAIAKFYKAGNIENPLDRVLVLVSPLNSSGVAQIDQELYRLFYQAKAQKSHLTTLLNYLHKEGISVLYVSFGHPANTSLPVVEKAKALAKVIERFNKIRNSRKNSSHFEKTNIMGLSLGGVVAKTALTIMEKAGNKHEMNVYFSMDSPHLGAHAPLGLQYLPQIVSSVFDYAKSKTQFAGFFDKLFDDILNLDFITKPVSQGASLLGQVSSQAGSLLTDNFNDIPTRELLAYNIMAKEGFRTKEFLKMRKETSSLPRQTKKNIAIANGSITGRTLDRTKPYFQVRTAKRNRVQMSLFVQPRGIADQYSYVWLKFPDRNQLFAGSRTKYYSIYSKKREVTEDTVPCATTTAIIQAAEIGVNFAISQNWHERVMVNNYSTCFVPTASALASKDGKEFKNSSFNASNSVFHEIIGGSQNTKHMHFSSEITHQIISKLKQYRK